MARIGWSPAGQSPAAVLTRSLLAALIAAMVACVTVSVWLAPASSRVPIAVGGLLAAAVVTVAVAEAVRRGHALTALRGRLAERDFATERLANELLPEAVARLQQGDSAEEVLSEQRYGGGRDPELDAPHRAVLRSVVHAVQAEEDLRDSAQRAFVNIARRVQAIVHQQASELREMEDRHGRAPDVFGDLLRMDHGIALIGRLADSIAVLGGARPGRQWSKPVPLFSVLRGAVSRILDYQRVDLHSVAEVAVIGPAVEPLIHALAELLDNATRYSPPQTRVHLTAINVQAGIAVEIEDGGVSLTEEARARAERLLTQAQAGIDLNDLGETPRLGLAVVGRLSQAYNFQVSLRPSAYGGVRAVLVVPQALITSAPATSLAHGIGASSGPPPEVPSRPAIPPQPDAPSWRVQDWPSPVTGAVLDAEDEFPVVTERTPSGLPQRRRYTGYPDTIQEAAPAGPIPVSGAPLSVAPQASAQPEPPGLWLAAFQSGLSGETPPATWASNDQVESSGMGE